MLTKLIRPKRPARVRNPESPSGRARRAVSGRRGMTSVLFAVCATALLGMSALGTEAGVWYLSLRQARNAADAAALAGASTHAAYGATSGRRSATAIATANGYTHGSNLATVTINSPPLAGAYVGVVGAYEVITTQTQMATLTRLITSSTPVVNVRAVAADVSFGPACVLALGNTVNGYASTGLDISGSSLTNSPSCVFASNLLGVDSIEVQGAAANVTINTFQSIGGCSGCTRNSVHLTSPLREYAGATTDPYAALQNFSQPTRSSLNCDTDGNLFGQGNGNGNNNSSSVNLSPTQGGRPAAFCSTSDSTTQIWSVTNGQTVNFAPGVYYFYNSTFQVNGGVVQCTTCTNANGVTLVFTGNTGANIGTFTLNGGATLNLHAGSSTATMANPMNGAQNYSGVLVYRDVRASCNGGGTGAGCGGNFFTTNINGGSNSHLDGAIYMPSTQMTYNGNATLSQTSCTIIVANSISFSGNVTNSGCSNYGTQTTQTRVARLVE